MYCFTYFLLQELDALVMPGGFCPDYLRRNKQIVQLVKDMVAAGCATPYIVVITSVLTLILCGNVETVFLHASRTCMCCREASSKYMPRCLDVLFGKVHKGQANDLFPCHTWRHRKRRVCTWHVIVTYNNHNTIISILLRSQSILQVDTNRSDNQIQLKCM